MVTSSLCGSRGSRPPYIHTPEYRVIESYYQDDGIAVYHHCGVGVCLNPEQRCVVYKRARMEKKTLFGVPKSPAQADLNQHIFYSNLKLRDESVMVSSHRQMLGRRLAGDQGRQRDCFLDSRRPRLV